MMMKHGAVFTVPALHILPTHNVEINCPSCMWLACGYLIGCTRNYKCRTCHVPHVFGSLALPCLIWKWWLWLLIAPTRACCFNASASLISTDLSIPYVKNSNHVGFFSISDSLYWHKFLTVVDFCYHSCDPRQWLSWTQISHSSPAVSSKSVVLLYWHFGLCILTCMSSFCKWQVLLSWNSWEY
jgi:hypothetical protein